MSASRTNPLALLGMESEEDIVLRVCCQLCIATGRLENSKRFVVHPRSMHVLAIYIDEPDTSPLCRCLLASASSRPERTSGVWRPCLMLSCLP